MKHKASLSFIGRTQKTAKTCCNKTVSTKYIAVHEDADCQECRAAADAELAGFKMIVESCRENGGSDANVTRLKETIHKYEPVRYRTTYFL